MGLMRAERGAVGALFAVALTGLVALSALGVDLGRLYVQRARVSAAVDAAALAGAQALPDDPGRAVLLAQEYLDKNNAPASAATVTVAESGDRIRVETAQDVAMSFARVLGLTAQSVSAGAIAHVGQLSGIQGVVPLAVRRGDYEAGAAVVLKVDAHSAEPANRGNFMALALGGRGANNFEEMVRNGYGDWLRVGDWVSTETGNMAGPAQRAIEDRVATDPEATWDEVGRRSGRLVKVAVIDDFNVNGRGEVAVVGLAVIFLEEVRGNPHQAEVTARFLRYVESGEMSGGAAADFGARVVRLER